MVAGICIDTENKRCEKMIANREAMTKNRKQATFETYTHSHAQPFRFIIISLQFFFLVIPPFTYSSHFLVVFFWQSYFCKAPSTRFIRSPTQRRTQNLYAVYFLCWPFLFLYLCSCVSSSSCSHTYVCIAFLRFLVLWQWLSFPYATIEFIAHQRLLTVNDYRSRFTASLLHFHVYFIIHFRISRQSMAARSFRSSNKLYGFYRLRC